MLENSLPVLLSRLDFAWITSFHILYPPLTIGLAVALFFFEWRWMRTNDEHWYRLTRFFEKLFIVNFGAGVATGITMEMAFGILYGPFSQAAGPFFGQVLGYETITAFMYEAGFIGLMIFGWGKINKKMHLFATFNVALSSALSAMWILVANSWMQTPTGVALKNGVFQVTDWFAAILNPDVMLGFPHMLIASFELALFFVAAVSAWFILKQRHIAMFQRPLKYAMLALIVIAPLQVYLGDGLGEVISHDQPAALASMEGHYHTYNKDGSVNTGWHVVAWPNAKGDGNAFAITIPHVLSVLETRTWSGKVPGLDSIKPQDRPPVVIPFYSFRIMVAIGMFLSLVAVWGVWLAIRGRLAVKAIAGNKWFLRTLVFSAFLPYAAVWTGWWTREIARQPWVVYGLMRTAAGVSHMSVPLELFWLVGYMAFELMVLGGAAYFIAKLIRKGPDMTSPIAHEGHQTLGHLEEPAPHEPAKPEYLRPA
ncbi:MAG: cytochrome ubiquinol oxidase subunit I [Acidiphilium sp.]|nr:cytochrome ubiquinol oxidase subunit I [Acidiphilium sp.]MDD4937217.1 cytochrome ubiquinol oxidase subunit I [Acidiphilium sp.]